MTRLENSTRMCMNSMSGNWTKNPTQGLPAEIYKIKTIIASHAAQKSNAI